jgi:hypothetical protein
MATITTPSLWGVVASWGVTAMTDDKLAFAIPNYQHSAQLLRIMIFSQ